MRRLAGIVVTTIAIFGSLGPLATTALARPKDKSTDNHHCRRADAGGHTNQETAVIPGRLCTPPTIVVGALRRVPR